MSKNASFELYLNRGLLFVGSTDDRVTVRVRAQIALVRVEIWYRHGPR